MKLYPEKIFMNGLERWRSAKQFRPPCTVWFWFNHLKFQRIITRKEYKTVMCWIDRHDEISPVTKINTLL